MSFEPGKEFQPKKLYTGRADVSVVMINPTLAEMQEKGVNYKEEPVYTFTTDEGVKKVRIDVWVDHPVVGLDKVAFFLANESKPSAAGNTQFINDYGQSSWAATKEDLLAKVGSWFKDENIRPAYTGEVELIDFLRKLLSIGKDGVSKIDNITKLIDGNVTELRDILKSAAGRKVQVLYIVKQSGDSWYQNIYTRYFDRGGSKSPTYWDKHMANVQSPPEYQGAWVLQEFDPLSFTPSDSTGDGAGDPWA